MTTQTERQIVKTFKGKADLIVGIISLIIGILFIRGGVLLSVWSFGYNHTG